MADYRGLSVHLGALTLRSTRNTAAAGPVLRRRAPAVSEPEDAHRLEPEGQLLAPVGGPDVQPAELLDPLQAVPDGVAVGEQLLRGAGDVSVGLEEGLHRLHEVGLVLLVVGHERLDRLGVEAL